MTQLTRHFTLDELVHSDYAIRHGLDNTPPADLLPRLLLLAAGLERVRAVLAVPIYVKSGYRCAAVNLGIGGSVSPPSQHMRGEAADFVAPAYGPPRQVCEAIVDHEDFIQFDQLILEGAWVHVSFADKPRGDILTAYFGGGPAIYRRGLA